MQIQVEDRQTFAAVDVAWLREALQQALRLESPRSVALTVALVDDAEIHRLNREFLDHDWPTDVISFGDADGPPPEGPPPRARGRDVVGDLVVSVETAARQAQAHGWSLQAELLLYALHGALHLCGYDDLTDAERRLMRQRERDLLQPFGLTPTGLES